MYRLTRCLVLCWFVLVALTNGLVAQISNLDNTTTPPIHGVGHDYIKMLGETVNPANGSVSLRIDLAIPKGRGLDVPFAVTYSSSGVHHVIGNPPNGGGAWGTDTGGTMGSGWGYSIPSLTSVQGIQSQTNPGPPPTTYSCYYYYSYVMQDWAGSAHTLGSMNGFQNPNDGSTGCNQITSSSNSDLTGRDDFFQGVTTIPTNPYWPDPVTVAGPDGTIYHFTFSTTNNGNGVYSYWGAANSIEDRNGNLLTASFQRGTNGVPYGTLQDTVGRSIAVSAPSNNSNTISVTGLSNSYIQNWASVPVAYSVNQTQVGSLPCSNPQIASAQSSNYVVKTLKLPNLTSFQFFYDSQFGLLTKIIYPTGGYVSYTWGFNPQSEFIETPGGTPGSGAVCDTIYDSPAITQRTVSFDGTTTAEVQTFCYSTACGSSGTIWPAPSQGSPQWTGKQTVVTTTDYLRGTQFQTIYTYAPTPASVYATEFAPTEKTIVYKDFSGAVLKTVTKAWIDKFLMGCQLETLDDGSTSGMWYFYGAGGQLTDKKEYDYGLIGSTPCQQGSVTLHGPVSSPPGGMPSRETVTTYQSFPAPPTFSSPTILDRPSTVKMYGSSGSLAAETDYVYDAYATNPITPVSAIGHDDTYYPSNYINRGNVTTKTETCLFGGAACTNSLTTYTYDQTGQIVSLTDPCGNGACADMTGATHSSYYYYADSYTSGSPSGNTNAYVTKIVDPLGHAQLYSWDFNSGQLTVSKDQNDISTNRAGTTYAYNDPFFRPTLINYPDGGQTAFAYKDAAPSSVTTCVLINGTAGAACSPSAPPTGWKTSVSILDGIGHVTQTQIVSDPDGVDYVDTSYDGLGRMYAVSNPHRGSSSFTDGTTTFTYDALGRTISVQRPDGSIVGTSYSGNGAVTTDEVGNSRGSYTDALGRLTRVDEPIPTELPTQASASITISDTGIKSSIQPATPGTGTFSVQGTEKQVYFCPAACLWTWDQGNVSLTVNGTVYDVGYSQGSTQSGLQSGLAGVVNGSPLVTAASNSNGSITVTARTAGANTNYPIVGGSQSTLHPTPSGAPVFSVYASGLGGGKNASTIYDSGTVSATVNGCSASAAYSLSGNNSGSMVATALAAALNASCSGTISASAIGNVVTVNALAVGVIGNSYTLSASSASSNPSAFNPPSFTVGVVGFGGGGGTGLTSPLTTFYTYDGLDNLIGVQQRGGTSDNTQWRNRSFNYDSLSRMTSSSNPETGVITYSYDANGNLSQRITPKVGQRGTAVTTHNYTYDVLNRLLAESHLNPADGSERYAYDGATLSGCGQNPPTITYANAIGRRSAMCGTRSGTAWSFDALGRPLLQSTRSLGSVQKVLSFNFTYNHDGSLSTVKYPSTNLVTYVIGSAGRPITVSDSHNNTFVSSATYAPHGAVAGMRSGNGIVTTNYYNSRLQPALLSAAGSAVVFSICYDFHSGKAISVGTGTQSCQFNAYTAGNNGNVYQVGNKLDSTRSATFGYDALNRLTNANTVNTTSGNCWGEVYSLDNWGNLTNIAGASGMGSCWTESFLGGSGTSTNQLTNFCYDAAGNLALNTPCPTGTLTPTYNYDSENRLSSTAGYSYYYDANGQRMEKLSGAIGTMYWAGPNGDYLSETDLSGNITEDYIYANGERIARIDQPSATVHYYFSDKLNSASVITDPNGTVQEQYFYEPFGGMVASIGSDPNHYKFNGKERDTESNLDQFGARYYAYGMGRFMSADWAGKPTAVPYAHYGNPQSLNLYSFVQNNPATMGDPDGHEEDPCGCTIAPESWSSAQWYFERLASNTWANIKTDATSLSNAIRAAAPGGMAGPDPVPDLGRVFQSNGGSSNASQPSEPTGQPETSTPAPEPDKAGGKPGEVYVTEPQESGKPYVGRTTQGVDQRMNTRTDGRTGKATAVDNYKTTEEGRYKEQKAIDQSGGVRNLDNKRNEVNQQKMDELKKKYENH